MRSNLSNIKERSRDEGVSEWPEGLSFCYLQIRHFILLELNLVFFQCKVRDYLRIFLHDGVFLTSAFNSTTVYQVIKKKSNVLNARARNAANEYALGEMQIFIQ